MSAGSLARSSTIGGGLEIGLASLDRNSRCAVAMAAIDLPRKALKVVARSVVVKTSDTVVGGVPSDGAPCTGGVPDDVAEDTVGDAPDISLAFRFSPSAAGFSTIEAALRWRAHAHVLSSPRCWLPCCADRRSLVSRRRRSDDRSRVLEGSKQSPPSLRGARTAIEWYLSLLPTPRHRRELQWPCQRVHLRRVRAGTTHLQGRVRLSDD